MYALRERRQHVTQEDFEFAIAKVSNLAAYVVCRWRPGLSTTAAIYRRLGKLTNFSPQVLKRNQDANTSVSKLFS